MNELNTSPRQTHALMVAEISGAPPWPVRGSTAYVYILYKKAVNYIAGRAHFYASNSKTYSNSVQGVTPARVKKYAWQGSSPHISACCCQHCTNHDCIAQGLHPCDCLFLICYHRMSPHESREARCLVDIEPFRITSFEYSFAKCIQPGVISNVDYHCQN